MRVMGIDPGLARCGVAVVDGHGRDVALAASHLIQTPAYETAGARLMQVSDAITDMLHTWRPDVMVLERLLFNANVRSAMAVAQAVGVVVLAAARIGVEVCDYTPTQVKATVTGYGDADKAQVKYLVAAQLRLAQAPHSADVADAAAIALCHLWRAGQRAAAAGSGGYSSRLAAAVARAAPGAQVVQPAVRASTPQE